MRFAPGRLLVGFWIGALLMTPGAAIAADDAEAETQPETRRAERVILAGLDAIPPETESEPFYTRFHLSHKRGVEYRQTIPMGEQKLSLKLYGPVVKKKMGLGLRLRGLRVADHALSLKAYGSRKKQGLKIEIEF